MSDLDDDQFITVEHPTANRWIIRNAAGEVAELARMAIVIQATRQFMYAVARLLAKESGEGVLEAAMVKAYACRTAEWVTREAM